MGRRKIEIKPIRDDRNRSVTFLKRKGGLFKKAHELSVLCSVDVAVIIFGHNKKLYEYSSGDIQDIIGRFQYYGAAHESKGPRDFADKGAAGDDDEDDEGGDDGSVERGTPAPVIRHQMPNHPGFQHMQGTPSSSPPQPNGIPTQFPRGPSPLPPGVSRPSSRTSQHRPPHATHIRTSSGNLVPPPPPQPGAGAPGYNYQPNAPFYHQQGVPRPPQGMPHGGQYPPGFQPPPSVQQALMEEHRRASMPTSYSQQQLPPQANMHLQPPQHQAIPRHLSPQPQHPHASRPTPSPQPQPQFASPPIPQPRPLPMSKAHVIFTPIDDSRSMLAQHWGAASAAQTSQPNLKAEDNSSPRSGSRDNTPRRSPPQVPIIQPPQRTASTPLFQPPSRASTHQSSSSADLKRPRLTVQIPSEQSDSDTGPASAPASSTAPSSHATGVRNGGHVLLPPPSPSAGSLMSAGAQGPPNPFARPAPPMGRDGLQPSNSNSNSNTIETPISALPSRFMSDNLLPSPSTFYPDWNFGRPGDPGMLPSPLNFSAATPGGAGAWDRRDGPTSAVKDAAPADRDAKMPSPPAPGARSTEHSRERSTADTEFTASTSRKRPLDEDDATPRNLPAASSAATVGGGLGAAEGKKVKT